MPVLLKAGFNSQCAGYKAGKKKKKKLVKIKPV